LTKICSGFNLSKVRFRIIELFNIKNQQEKGDKIWEKAISGHEGGKSGEGQLGRQDRKNKKVKEKKSIKHPKSDAGNFITHNKNDQSRCIPV
jgi:hypothetical protein